MRSGVQQIPPMNAVYFGASAADALALEVEKRRSQRVFLLVSGTLNRETKEINKVRATYAS
jgi:maleylacetate reductase